MKIESNMFVYRVDNNPQRRSKDKRWNTSDKCPFCGYVLQHVDGSNIKVCTNENCNRNQSFYQLL